MDRKLIRTEVNGKVVYTYVTLSIKDKEVDLQWSKQ